MMRLGQPGETLIKSKETLSLAPYHGRADAADVFTIGWGAIRYLDGTRVRMSSPAITEPQAESLFLRDTFIPLQCIEACVSGELSQNQIDALTALVFNIGETNFQHSTLLRNINRGETDRIPAQWLRWDRADGREVRGLAIRRQQELDLWLS